jgi:hypothetical protein
MKINIEFRHFIGIKDINNNSVLTMPDNSKVIDIYPMLGIQKNRHGIIIPFVNNEPVWNSAVLKENDRLVLHAPVGGG